MTDFTKAKIDFIRNMLIDGMTYESIGKVMGVKKQTIMYYIKRYGLPTSKISREYMLKKYLDKSKRI